MLREHKQRPRKTNFYILVINPRVNEALKEMLSDDEQVLGLKTEDGEKNLWIVTSHEINSLKKSGFVHWEENCPDRPVDFIVYTSKYGSVPIKWSPRAILSNLPLCPDHSSETQPAV